jgi:hypothetical protein
MTDKGFTTDQKYHNSAHETGHALSLFHFENSPEHVGDHWMRSGQISLTSPSSQDADHVAWKW